jgi:hypothetical protein
MCVPSLVTPMRNFVIASGAKLSRASHVDAWIAAQLRCSQ